MFQKRAHSRPAQQSTGNCAAVNSSDVGLLALQSVPPHGKHNARVGLQPWPPPSLATHALAQFPEQPLPVLAGCHLPRIRHQVCTASAPSPRRPGGCERMQTSSATTNFPIPRPPIPPTHLIDTLLPPHPAAPSNHVFLHLAAAAETTPWFPYFLPWLLSPLLFPYTLLLLLNRLPSHPPPPPGSRRTKNVKK